MSKSASRQRWKKWEATHSSMHNSSTVGKSFVGQPGPVLPRAAKGMSGTDPRYWESKAGQKRRPPKGAGRTRDSGPRPR
jgi:hypothetical protein